VCDSCGGGGVDGTCWRVCVTDASGASQRCLASPTDGFLSLGSERGVNHVPSLGSWICRRKKTVGMMVGG